MSDFTAQRAKLKEANARALEGQMSLTLSAKLDSSLKKNTSFIKKIKGLNADTAPGILADISALTLEKYLSEITASLAEGLLKLSKNDDINAGVVVISVLFQRFGDSFSAPLLSHMVNASLDKADPEPVLRQKTALKFVFEMHLVGVCQTFSDCSPEILAETAAKYYSKLGSNVVSVSLLKDVMGYKLDQGYSLPVATTFLKRFSGLLKDDSDNIAEGLRDALRQLFGAYTARILESLKALRAKETKLEASNKKASIRTGKILAEHQDLVDEVTLARTHFETHAAVLCELLGMEMPLVETPLKKEQDTDVTVEESTRNWWHDTKEREFYQEVPNYTDVIENFDKKKLPHAEYNPLSEGQRVVLFISQLEALLDAKDLDLMTAIMHTYIPYNKATRHRIIRFFTEVKKIDNVNVYARFLKINASFFPDVIAELIEGLDRGFRSQIHFDTLNFRNLAFFIELVKFKLIPSHVVFHKIRRMTLNIAGTSNVDILSVFYERCGKFLLFEAEYSETTKEMLELLQIQAKSDKLTISEKLALSNMFLIVNAFTAPPQTPQTKPKLTTIQDFIHQCIKKLVTPTSCVVALEILSSIDFSRNEEARLAFIDVYLKPEDLGADHLHSICELLLGLGKTQRHLAVSTIDGLTEKVIWGLERNDYRKNVARMAQVKMFAALFNSRVLNFRSILDLLYKIVCFAYPNNLPVPNSSLDIDAPDNYFRIHLVCALLKSINMHKVTSIGMLNNGVKTVEGFLVFLQYYAFCKVLPLPKDIEYSLVGVFESFNAVSKAKLPAVPDLPAAMQSLQKYISEHKEGTISQSSADTHTSESVVSDDSDSGSESESSDEDSGSDSDIDDESIAESMHSETSQKETSEKTTESEDSSDSETEVEYEEEDEEEHVFQLRSTAEKLEAQRMDDEINTLLSASVHSSKISTPLKMPAPSSLMAPAQNESEPPKAFKFLTKANRLRDLSLPTNNQFTERIASEQAAQKANRQKIMSLVNNMYES